MIETVLRYLNRLDNRADAAALSTPARAVASALSTCSIRTAGLVISASTLTAQIGAAAYYAFVQGRLRTVAAAVAMPALVGTVINATFNVYAFFLDSAGTTTSVMGTAGATLNAVRFPDLPPDKAFIGFVIVNPTGAGNFVGGTTPLGDAGVVPNAVFISPLCAVDPTYLYS